MGEFPDLPEQPPNWGYHARHWNRRSGGWASIDTPRSDPPLPRTSLASDLRGLLIVRHFAEPAALRCASRSFRFSGFRMASCLHWVSYVGMGREENGNDAH